MNNTVDYNTVVNYGKLIHYSQMFGTKNEYEGAMIAAMCFQEGISFFAFKRDFHFIMGNISKKADAMLASFAECGGKKKIIQADENKVIIDFELNGEKYQGICDWGKLQNEPYTRATKDAAGHWCLNLPIEKRPFKENYATPVKRGQMLFARCVSDSLRRICPKACAGYYTPEEITDFAIKDDAVMNTAEETAAEIQQPQAAPIPAAVKMPQSQAIPTQTQTQVSANVQANDLQKQQAAPQTVTMPQPQAQAQTQPQTVPQMSQPMPQPQAAGDVDYSICRIPNAKCNGQKWTDIDTEALKWAADKLPISAYFTTKDRENVLNVLKSRDNSIPADN